MSAIDAFAWTFAGALSVVWIAAAIGAAKGCPACRAFIGMRP